jgi:hypothetical protein
LVCLLTPPHSVGPVRGVFIAIPLKYVCWAKAALGQALAIQPPSWVVQHKERPMIALQRSYAACRSHLSSPVPNSPTVSPHGPTVSLFFSTRQQAIYNLVRTKESAGVTQPPGGPTAGGGGPTVRQGRGCALLLFSRYLLC